ncbi:hypothetical protein WDU94_012077 [Cyamophila willieti]
MYQIDLSLKRISCVLFVFLLIWCVTDAVDDNRYLSPKKFGQLRGDEIIRFYGYPGEEHKVLTEDGYILTNFRIANPGGYPILFIHGLTATSDCWFVGGPAHDLSFRLWRRGYDVWLWNGRGNLYSMDHVNISWSDEKFYKFSMHELGYYDTTASIDYILNVTGHKSVITIGHSMGTTNVLIAAASRPEYQPKIALNILLAPGAFQRNLVTRGFSDTSYSQYVRWFNFDHLERILEKDSFYFKINQLFCDPTGPTAELCYFSMGLISGLGSNQTVKDAVMKMMTKFPAGTSLNVLKQEIQNLRSGDFSPLSYSRKENLKRYGTPKPSPYPLGKVQIPTAIYYGCCNDLLSHVKDTKLLKSRLPNVIRFYKVPYRLFNHGDFLWAKDAYRLLYKDIIILIDQFTPYQYRSNVTIEPVSID